MITENNYQLIIGDAIKVLLAFPAYLNFIFADPPFNINYNKSSHECGDKSCTYEDRMSKENYEQFTLNWISACYDALAPDGSLVINIGWQGIPAMEKAIEQTEFIVNDHAIWEFEFGVYAKRRCMIVHNHLYHLVKSKKRYTFNPYTVNPNTKRKGNPYEKSLWCSPPELDKGNENDWVEWRTCQLKSVWRNPPGHNRGNDKDRVDGHPCQLPLWLLRRVLLLYSNEGDLVGDVFSGSGGLMRECRLLGRSVIAIEKNDKYESVIREKAMLERSVVKMVIQAKQGFVQTSLVNFGNESANKI